VGDRHDLVYAHLSFATTAANNVRRLNKKRKGDKCVLTYIRSTIKAINNDIFRRPYSRVKTFTPINEQD